MVAKAERSRTNRGHDLDLLMPRDVICHVTIAAPRGLLELTENVIRSSYGHSTASLKISCKSVQPFTRNVTDKELSITASRGLHELTQKEICVKVYRRMDGQPDGRTTDAAWLYRLIRMS